MTPSYGYGAIRGAADIKAPPERVLRLMEEYAV